MKETYIAIHEEEVNYSNTTARNRILFSAKSAKKKPIVDFQKLTVVEALEFAKKNTLKAFGRAVPIKLIKPKLKKINKARSLKNGNWGLNELGVDTSIFNGDGVTVAILDTGIFRDHPAFKGITIIEKDFTGEGNGDSNGHGTHCAGIIAGRPVDNVKIGVATGVNRLLIGKVLNKDGEGTTENIIDGIEWAVEEGANVISISIGIDFPGLVSSLRKKMNIELAVSRALEDYRNTINIFETLINSINSRCEGQQIDPVIIVAAAGNESRRDYDKDFVLSVSPPATCKGILSVGAVDKTEQGYEIAPFSNTGATILAPGVDIVSAKINGGYVSYSGTSMATPHVAGIAALWVEKLNKQNQFILGDFLASVIVSGRKENFSKNVNRNEIRNGVIFAPQT